MIPTDAPDTAFREFLEKAKSESWITSFQWASASHLHQVREKLGGPCPASASRSHKQGGAGSFWGVQVAFHPERPVGIDLEFLENRKILKTRDWLIRRLGLASDTTVEGVLEEWALREAAFKSATRWFQYREIQTEGLHLGLFRHRTPLSLELVWRGSQLQFEGRASWSVPWVVCLVRLTSAV